MDYQASLTFARARDQEDELGGYQAKFFLPLGLARDGKTVTYLAGNSLGLQPRAATDFVEDEMDRWNRFAVEGHFLGDTKWVDYHTLFTKSLAKIVGANESEVVAMGELSANLHLLLASFYRPEGERKLILMEAGAFPSDRFIVESHVKWHGLDPKEVIVEVHPEDGRYILETDQITETIGGLGDELALVMMSGVQYFTGQYFDIENITKAAHAVGAKAGWDCAHAVGNVPMLLHDWNVDFAVWCSYKYLNGGPGAPAGIFVHDTHGLNPETPRLAGWWGHNRATRFNMDGPFDPMPGAEGWQLSNASVIGLTPLRASLELFDDAGIMRLRERSRNLTGYLEFMINRADPDYEVFEIITPTEPKHRGCQLSVAVHGPLGKPIFDALKMASIICDWREPTQEGGPGVIRLAPTPLYNTYMDILRAGETLRVVLETVKKQMG